MQDETYNADEALENTDLISDQNINDSTDVVLTDEEYQEVIAKIEKAEKLEKENAKLKKLFQNAREHTKQNINNTTQNDQTQDTPRDELRLVAKGFSDGEIEYINKVAVLEGITPLQASEHPIFISYKKNQEDKDRSQKAQLGTSKRSQSFETPKTFSTPNTSRDEHVKMFERYVLNK